MLSSCSSAMIQALKACTATPGVLPALQLVAVPAVNSLLQARWQPPAALFSTGATPKQNASEVSSSNPTAAGPSETAGQSADASGPQGRPTLLDGKTILTAADFKGPLASSQYASSMDDMFGVQKNWFTALYKQLNAMAKTGLVPHLSGRQRKVFEAVEAEFERLYQKHIKDKQLDATSHRATLMVCLSVATYKVLDQEVGNTQVIKEVIRTNLGSMMTNVLMPIHRFKIWVLKNLLAEHPYQQAVKMLPALTTDMGSLCQSEIVSGDEETVLTVHKCNYHSILTEEDAPFLLTEFCCHHSLLWLSEFRKHGVIVSLDNSMVFEDECCQLRIAKNRPKLPTEQSVEKAEGKEEGK